MRIGRNVVIAALVLVVLGLGAAYLVLRGPVVDTVQPHRGDIAQTVVSSGRVLPPAEIKIGALINSTVREVFVDAGDPVRAGELLVTLDDREIAASLAEAEAALERARAGRYELTVLSAPEARAHLRRADADLAHAENKLRINEQLFASGAASRAERDDAETAVAVARALRDAAQLQLTATSHRGSRAAVAAAAVAQAEARVALVRSQLDRTRVHSPVDGVVLARHLEPGDAVVVGSRMLLLARTGQTRLVIEPDERNLALLSVGQDAVASAEAFPKERFASRVTYIAPAVDPQRGTVEVHLHVPAPPDYLRPHMTVSVEVGIGKRERAIVVPRSAVRALASPEPHVFVAGRGKVERVDVELGIVGDELVEVRSGLAADAAIVSPLPTDLMAGDRVRVRGGG